MKNNIKNETPQQIPAQESNADNSNVKMQETEEMSLRMTAIEEKMGAYEEKIDLIVSYLETINENNRDIAESKVTGEEKAVENDNSEVLTDEKLIARNIYEIARKDLYEELLPLVECARKYKDREERDKVIKMMILTEEMADAADKADEMDEIIEKYPALKNSRDLMEKYVTAYVILKGRDACCNGKTRSVEDLMEIFESDDEFRKAVTLKIRDDLKKQNSVPNMNFDGGITSLNIEEKPKNMKDAKNATFRLFK